MRAAWRGAAGLVLAVCFALQGPARAETDAEFGERVRSYLLANPEVILEAMEVLQARQEEIAVQNRLAPHIGTLFETETDLRMGGEDASRVIVEFFDYNCPICKANMPVLEKFVSDHRDVMILKKHLPIISPASERAARYVLAARAVYGPKVSAALHDRIYAAPGALSEALLAEIAGKLDLYHTAISARMQDAEITAIINSHRDIAIALGIVGTPVFATRTRMHTGTITAEGLEALLD